MNSEFHIHQSCSFLEYPAKFLKFRLPWTFAEICFSLSSCCQLTPAGKAKVYCTKRASIYIFGQSTTHPTGNIWAMNHQVLSHHSLRKAWTKIFSWGPQWTTYYPPGVEAVGERFWPSRPESFHESRHKPRAAWPEWEPVEADWGGDLSTSLWLAGTILPSYCHNLPYSGRDVPTALWPSDFF